MKVTVCELSQEEDDFISDWKRLVEHVQTEASDLVLLPEMIFSPWFAANRPFDPEIWRSVVSTHDEWIPRLKELAPATILGSRPVESSGKRLNESFLWDEEAGYRRVHAKYYLPDEEGFWEDSWYERGDGSFTPVEVRGVKIGFMICTDIWFFHHARAYAKAGVHLIAHPRATQRVNLDKWLTAGRAASVVSGAFCLSSNHVSPRGSQPELGGMGWITGPDGEVLGTTRRERPFLTKDIDLKEAELAKTTYPRYVVDD
jgi:N-carbamoylputrescine amidase